MKGNTMTKTEEASVPVALNKAKPVKAAPRTTKRSQSQQVCKIVQRMPLSELARLAPALVEADRETANYIYEKLSGALNAATAR